VAGRTRALPARRGDGVYLGMVRAADLVEVPPEGREAMPVGNLLAEVPAVRPNPTLGEALAAMEEGGVDRVAVVDGRRFVGVVVREGLLQLDRALEAVEDRLEDEA
jgi:CBS domain-containing protein